MQFFFCFFLFGLLVLVFPGFVFWCLVPWGWGRTRRGGGGGILGMELGVFFGSPAGDEEEAVILGAGVDIEGGRGVGGKAGAGEADPVAVAGADPAGAVMGATAFGGAGAGPPEILDE